MTAGYVYVLVNDSMPGLYKIGATRNAPDYRAYQLGSASGVPLGFSLLAYGLSDSCFEDEAKLHGKYGDSRVSGKREFFRLSVDLLESLVDDVVYELDGGMLSPLLMEEQRILLRKQVGNWNG